MCEQARSQPDRFHELVDHYSEHRTATVGGDFGSYSTTSPWWFPRQVEVLGRLEVGEIAAPIETLVGCEIIQRTPERPRALYAMDSLWLAFAADAPDAEPNSRASVLAQARTHTEAIAGDAQRFDELGGTAMRAVSMSFAAAVGYVHPNHFSSAFRRLYGVSPAEHRSARRR